MEMLGDKEAKAFNTGELMECLKKYLGIHLTFDETDKLTGYLDTDYSGDVDLNEFGVKMDYFMMRLASESQNYKISLTSLLQKLIQEWGFHRDRERVEIMQTLSEHGFSRT